MNATEPQFVDVGTGDNRRRIAYRQRGGGQPGLMWLSGFKSEMTSTKASALDQWAGNNGLACTRFDYSGHGQSSGRFEDGTISRWLDEAETVFATLTDGPQVLVGSSMGGYIALLLLRRFIAGRPALAVRIKALALIAPAWDMTEALIWKDATESQRKAVMETGVWLRPSQYGDPYPITRGLIEDGRRHLIGGTMWDPGRPIHIMHGLLDPDVPWEHSLELESNLTGGWTRVSAVPDGEHRLSRPEDLDLLFEILKGL